MRPGNPNRNRRLQNRVPAVLPVRVRGIDVEGQPFQEIAHTLDITATGARVAAIHHQLRIADRVTVIYRQRRTAFSVVWAKAIDKHEISDVSLLPDDVIEVPGARGGQKFLNGLMKTLVPSLNQLPYYVLR